MNLVALSVRQPVTVAVGVILILLAGVVSLRRIPIQLTPNVEDTIIAVTTRWEGASPAEVEREVVDPQEEKLQGLAGLRAITSTCQQGQGQIRLEFQVGVPKEVALREVSDKLREVPEYPPNVDEPVIDASDPENRDYIAWIVLEADDESLDIRTLQDFTEDRVEPVLERIQGISEVNVLGGREREVQVRYDPVALAAAGLSPADLVGALRRANRDVSGGAVEEQKSDVRVRLTALFERPQDVEAVVIADLGAGPVRVRDVAEVVETFKEPTGFVRSRGRPVIAINADREVGANVMEVMAGLRAAIDKLNAPGGLLETQARELGLEGGLRLTQVYDQTVYIDDALALVRSNIWIGGGLATLVLILFLRSARTVGIVALAIPISVVGAVVAMVAMGRSVNVISLAGMAFAVGMVVDNAIVVLENVYRHVEMGKPPVRAAIDGGSEVWGAVLAATLTTVAVFIPILMIEEEAGQLFRDIALAIVAAVALSLLVSVTVIPASAARLLRARNEDSGPPKRARIAGAIAGTVHWLNGSVIARVGLVAAFTGLSIWGTWELAPPTDYLPTGNRNLMFGLMIPPPSYNQDQLQELGRRVEETVRPFWEAGELDPATPEGRDALAALPEVPNVLVEEEPPPPIVPPALENYFFVQFSDILFHGAVSADSERVVDIQSLFARATRSEVLPGVWAFAFQVPLFRLGGTSGSALKINLAGDDLDEVAHATTAIFMRLMGIFGQGQVQPSPSNYGVPVPELRVLPDRERLAEAGLSEDVLDLAVMALGDGSIVGDYRVEGDTIDLKVLALDGSGRSRLDLLEDTPIATPAGVLPLGALARIQRGTAPQQINRVGRQRAITLQLTPDETWALEDAVDRVAAVLDEAREDGTLSSAIDTSFTGSASKLAAVRGAMLGDGTLTGVLGSSLVLALVVVYLLLCVLFQSFMTPLIIMVSVPLATLGGFLGLAAVHAWSQADPYLPLQKLDVLTMLGFVILIGVVVNNAILIVHQTLNFLRGGGAEGEDVAPLPPREAITEAVRTRVRPIFMSTLTSVGGMAPLVLMPGSGSELYRGLGSVVVGGLLVSTVFTLLLVPLLLSLVLDVQARLGLLRGERSAAPARGAAQAALLLLLVGVLAGCASRFAPGEPPSATLELARARAAAVTGEAAEAPVPAPAVVHALPPALVERADELEALGGPESWRAVDAELGPDLLGGVGEELPLALDDVLRGAVEHNLSVRLARVRPEERDADVEFEAAAFDTVLFADLEYERVKAPRPVPVLGGIQLGTPVSTSNRQVLGAGARKLLASGATVTASTYFERFDDSTSGIDFVPDPAYRAGVSLDMVQPLLKGSGELTTTAALELARLAAERSEEDLAAEVLLVAALAEQAYWDLRQASERLQVLQRLTAQGEEVEGLVRARGAFDASPAELADALATVEQRRANLVRARTAVRERSDALKALLSDPALPLEGEELLRAADPFPDSDAAGGDAPALADALRTAVERRPELRAALLVIEDATLREEVARDSLESRLDLVGRLDLAGEDDGFDEAYNSLTSDDLLGWVVGLSWELPVGNRAAEADARRARYQARAALVAYEEALQGVVLDVKTALRDLLASGELLAAARATRLAQTENLRSLEVERERRSAWTPEFLRLLLGAQDRLALAQLEEVGALATHGRAQAALARAMGTGRAIVRP